MASPAYPALPRRIPVAAAAVPRALAAVVDGLQLALLVHLFAFVLLLAAALMPSLVLGWGSLTVLTGSMEPALPPGTAVVAAPPDGPLVHPTIITFTDPAAPGTTTTHRIIETALIDGVPRYRTQGDANATADPGWVAHDDVVGAVRLVVPYAGLPARWVAQGSAAAFSLWLVVLLLGGCALADLLRAPAGDAR
jgi:signal peptidase I